MSNKPVSNLQPAQQALIAEINELEMKVFQFVGKLKNMTGPDYRNVSIGWTHAEDAFMRLRRSIADGQQDPGFYRDRNQQEKN